MEFIIIFILLNKIRCLYKSYIERVIKRIELYMNLFLISLHYSFIFKILINEILYILFIHLKITSHKFQYKKINILIKILLLKKTKQ